MTKRVWHWKRRRGFRRTGSTSRIAFMSFHAIKNKTSVFKQVLRFLLTPIVSVFTKGKQRRKRDVASVAVMATVLLIVGFFIGSTVLAAPYATPLVPVYRVFYGVREVGAVQDKQAFMAALTVAQTDFKNTYNMDMVLDEPLRLEESLMPQENALSIEEGVQAFLKNITVKVNATVITIGGRAAAALTNREDAQWVLDEILKPYKVAADKQKLKDISFVEQVEIKEQVAAFGLINSKEKTFENVMLGTDQKNLYTVKKGDTLWDIAMKNGLRVSDLRKANPSAATTDIIQIGQELNLVAPLNLINVQYTQVVSQKEGMPFSVRTQKDSSLMNGQKKIKQKGVAGTRETIVHVKMVNGMEVNKEIISEKVIVQPVTQIVLQGTASVTASGVLGTSSYGFLTPTRGYISSSFGMRNGSMHYGVDIANNKGTPIYAAKAGVVTRSDYDSGGYGKWIEIEHSDGSRTRYGHCSTLKVVKGQKVERGKLIALMGSTGRSTGPHLHFEIRINSTPVNPLTRILRPSS